MAWDRVCIDHLCDFACHTPMGLWADGCNFERCNNTPGWRIIIVGFDSMSLCLSMFATELSTTPLYCTHSRFSILHFCWNDICIIFHHNIRSKSHWKYLNICVMVVLSGEFCWLCSDLMKLSSTDIYNYQTQKHRSSWDQSVTTELCEAAVVFVVLL